MFAIGFLVQSIIHDVVNQNGERIYEYLVSLLIALAVLTLVNKRESNTSD